MKYIRLGNSGLKITELIFGSALTIGTEIMDSFESESLIDKAWELGIRTFDVSNNYGDGEAERLVGSALKKYPREEYVLITKGSWPIGDSPYHRGLSRKHILWTIEESMKRLECDFVDIYFAHRYDPEVPMEEIVRTFNYLINTGKIRYWGTSEWPLTALQECKTVCEKFNLEGPITEQFIYSFAVQKSVKSGVKEFCDHNGIGTMGFSPLCQGYLTGKYRYEIPKDSRIAKSDLINYNKTQNFYIQNKERIDAFISICDEMNVDYVSAALQWCIRQKIYPVFGSSKISQLEANVKAIDTILPEELWKKLESIQ